MYVWPLSTFSCISDLRSLHLRLRSWKWCQVEALALSSRFLRINGRPYDRSQSGCLRIFDFEVKQSLRRRGKGYFVWGHGRKQDLPGSDSAETYAYVMHSVALRIRLLYAIVSALSSQTSQILLSSLSVLECPHQSFSYLSPPWGCLS